MRPSTSSRTSTREWSFSISSWATCNPRTPCWPSIACPRRWRSSCVVATLTCSKPPPATSRPSGSTAACASLSIRMRFSRPSMAWLTAENDQLTVLVVEDDQQMLRTLSDILRHRGYAAATAATGSAAIERIAHGGPPAIALVDLVLPDMAGLEVVRALRSLSRSTQVVVLTGHASFDSALSALREETYDYLIKPVAPDALLQTIDRAG